MRSGDHIYSMFMIKSVHFGTCFSNFELLVVLDLAGVKVMMKFANPQFV